MKKKLLILLFSLTSLALTSCGGGNEGASTGSPVVAQATIFDPTANGGCGNSSSYKGSGPVLTKEQRMACIIALTIANNSQTCIDMGGLYIPITLPSSLSACVPLGGNWGYGMEGGLTLEYCSSIGGFTVGSNPSTALCYYPGGCNLPAFRDYPECK